MSTRPGNYYENLSERFMLKSHDYQNQYSHLYAHRLAKMTELLKVRAESKWGLSIPIKKLCDIREDQCDETCILIGTVYKHQVYKPSILREISEENQLAPQPQRENFYDAEDKLILEDELQRVRLHGKIDSRIISTGVVCAVYGLMQEDGRFEVEEMVFFEGGPQRPLTTFGFNRYLVIISGIDIQSLTHIDSLNLFQHWICGNLNGSSSMSLNIVRLIVAGNTVNTTADQKAQIGQIRIPDTSNDLIKYLGRLDEWFSSLAKSIPIDLMPGACDPANFMLPQQPLHSCMFPSAARHNSFQSVTNPYHCHLDGLDILGCSGQNVSNLLRSTQMADSMDALKSTLIWSHIAPTAPDTLPCYPFVRKDPFIIEECPHIYFTANCNEFATCVHEGSQGQQTRLICVPSFTKKQSVAVVDLGTLYCTEISFTCEELNLNYL